MKTSMVCWLVLILVLMASSTGVPLAAADTTAPGIQPAEYRSQGGDGGTTYYVSSSSGDDDNNGLSPGTAFATVAKVNSLDLQPGDRVLFACGDIWRTEPLVISKSGTEAEPIIFGSNPEGCANQPVLSGAQPVSGWTAHSSNIYVADLSGGDNAGKFRLGLNQLFQDGERLPFGRWPNLDANADGGYSEVDGVPSSTQIADNELPAGDWTGAAIHIKTERWLLVNREVTGSSAQTLRLNESVSCRDGCVGWGYFLNNHLGTLDQEGEWYYDAGTNRVYVYSTGGPPGNVEGAVILDDYADTDAGGVMLGTDLPIAHVVVENLAIEDWFNFGISGSHGMVGDVYHDVTIRGCTIRDVETVGIRLKTWIWSAENGRDGLRGGHHMAFAGNVIEGANHFGIDGFFHTSTFEDNQIRNIGLIKNLGKSGLGCGFTGMHCTEYGSGMVIRRHWVEDSGHSNTVRYNRIERTGYNGIDVFGPNNTFEYNFIQEACYSKGDCGGVRTFGNDSLTTTEIHDLTFRNNIIVDSIGNADGVLDTYHQLMAMGLYIDNYSRDVVSVDNTIVNPTYAGILYQRSTGEARGNTIYNAVSGTIFAGQLHLAGGETQVTSTDNVLYGLRLNAWTLYLYDLGNLVASDYNYFFQPYVGRQIAYGPRWTRQTFSQWQTLSGQDAHSKKNWFTLEEGSEPLSRIFYNATKSPLMLDLGDRQYLNLDQNQVVGSVTLQPFTSIVLVDDGPASLALVDMSPRMMDVGQPSDFVLDLFGARFTENSVVRWGGAERPTTFVSDSWLRATIYAADVSTVADIPVTVYDPSPPLAGTETPPLTFRVIESVLRVYLPAVLK